MLKSGQSSAVIWMFTFSFFLQRSQEFRFIHEQAAEFKSWAIQIWQVWLCRVLREGYYCVDFVAKLGSSQADSVLVEWLFPPQSCSNFDVSSVVVDGLMHMPSKLSMSWKPEGPLRDRVACLVGHSLTKSFVSNHVVISTGKSQSMLAEPLPYEKVCTEWDCVAFLLSLALGPEAKCSSQENFMEGVADSVVKEASDLIPPSIVSKLF
ncbi:hypothetical protein POTOM_024571 [Populus tomentosa]|uniref:Uncharacterized protein n=1 Tax=Populus tomentosa TaxID=118781 RepID=A0A8X7ZJH2_POPTO|nr:hypothetical protein POTOM_024571 [Populus tomentosa]